MVKETKTRSFGKKFFKWLFSLKKWKRTKKPLLSSNVCVCVSVCVCSVAQSCLTPRDPIGCSPPVSSIHGISQARILEWAAISFSGGPSWPRDGTRMSGIGRQIFATAPPGSGRCPGGQSNALQCPCCRLPWAAEPGATLHRVTKSPIQPERFRRHALSTRI